MKIKKYPN